MEINEEKRQKFMEYAGKRVNNVLHDMQILEPMSRSASYDFTRQDVEEMLVNGAIQASLTFIGYWYIAILEAYILSVLIKFFFIASFMATFISL